MKICYEAIRFMSSVKLSVCRVLHMRVRSYTSKIKQCSLYNLCSHNSWRTPLRCTSTAKAVVLPVHETSTMPERVAMLELLVWNYQLNYLTSLSHLMTVVAVAERIVDRTSPIRGCLFNGGLNMKIMLRRIPWIIISTLALKRLERHTIIFTASLSPRFFAFSASQCVLSCEPSLYSVVKKQVLSLAIFVKIQDNFKCIYTRAECYLSLVHPE